MEAELTTTGLVHRAMRMLISSPAVEEPPPEFTCSTMALMLSLASASSSSAARPSGLQLPPPCSMVESMSMTATVGPVIM